MNPEDVRNAVYFEDQATRAIENELTFVLSTWLDSYNIIALDDLELPRTPHGMFVMLAPGRIKFSDKPKSIAAELLLENVIPEAIDVDALKRAIRFKRRDFDTHLRQVIAMQRLARQGEPELAAVGCITAIEWFLNSALSVNHNDPERRRFSLSVPECLKREPLRTLPEELKRSIAAHRLAEKRHCPWDSAAEVTQ